MISIQFIKLNVFVKFYFRGLDVQQITRQIYLKSSNINFSHKLYYLMIKENIQVFQVLNFNTFLYLFLQNSSSEEINKVQKCPRTFTCLISGGLCGNFAFYTLFRVKNKKTHREKIIYIITWMSTLSAYTLYFFNLVSVSDFNKIKLPIYLLCDNTISKILKIVLQTCTAVIG